MIPKTKVYVSDKFHRLMKMEAAKNGKTVVAYSQSLADIGWDLDDAFYKMREKDDEQQECENQNNRRKKSFFMRF